jgi:uncharacterized damage-inducible protein DinB
MACEDTTGASSGLTIAELWARPGGAGSVGFHLMHLAGATDRLLTYARGESLSDDQRRALLAEGECGDSRPALDGLLANWHSTIERALAQLAATPESALQDPRFVGRMRLPSTVMGLLFHAAEHASRHTGQLVTTARVVRGGA